MWKYIWLQIGLLPKSPLAAAAETLNAFVKFPLPALATRHLDLSSIQAFKDAVLPFVTHRIGLVRPKMGKPESRPGSVSKTCFSSLLGLFWGFLTRQDLEYFSQWEIKGSLGVIKMWGMQRS